MQFPSDDMPFPARLEGGMFDGDFGYWTEVAELPMCFWAVACENPFCPAGRVHWVPDPIAGTQLRGEKYLYDRMCERDGRVAVYVHAELDYDGIFGRGLEKVTA